MDLGIHFAMKTNKQKIVIKSTENTLIRTNVLIYPLIDRF